MSHPTQALAKPHLAAQAEQVHLIQPMEASVATLDSTLVCYVLVDASTAHAFCSSYDMGPWPLLPNISSLSPSALQVGESWAVPWLRLWHFLRGLGYDMGQMCGCFIFVPAAWHPQRFSWDFAGRQVLSMSMTGGFHPCSPAAAGR